MHIFDQRTRSVGQEKIKIKKAIEMCCTYYFQFIGEMKQVHDLQKISACNRYFHKLLLCIMTINFS